MPSHSASPGPDPDRPVPRDAADSPGLLVLDRRAARSVDARAVSQYGLPTIVLMENAARAVAEEVAALAGDVDRPSVLIVCGPGSNGGDGLGAARHLHNAGADVAVLLAAVPGHAAADAELNLRVVRAMGLPVTVCASDPASDAARALESLGRADVIVDALFGTGLDRAVGDPYAALIDWINTQGGGGVPVLAVDIPSGIDCDTGRPLGKAVRADVTVSFAALKRGFLELGAQEYVGDIVAADIGVPRALIEELGTALEAHRPGADDAELDEPAAPSPKPGDSAT